MQCEENKSTSRRSESQAHVVSPVLGHVSTLPVRRRPDAQPASHGLHADWSRRSLWGGVMHGWCRPKAVFTCLQWDMSEGRFDIKVGVGVFGEKLGLSHEMLQEWNTMVEYINLNAAPAGFSSTGSALRYCDEWTFAWEKKSQKKKKRNMSRTSSSNGSRENWTDAGIIPAKNYSRKFWNLQWDR